MLNKNDFSMEQLEERLEMFCIYVPRGQNFRKNAQSIRKQAYNSALRQVTIRTQQTTKKETATNITPPLLNINKRSTN
ncbi:MAG: hypothetical protein R3A44_01475 [Caldilineaceae bacterium]